MFRTILIWIFSGPIFKFVSRELVQRGLKSQVHLKIVFLVQEEEEIMRDNLSFFFFPVFPQTTKCNSRQPQIPENGGPKRWFAKPKKSGAYRLF